MKSVGPRPSTRITISTTSHWTSVGYVGNITRAFTIMGKTCFLFAWIDCAGLALFHLKGGRLDGFRTVGSEIGQYSEIMMCGNAETISAFGSGKRQILSGIELPNSPSNKATALNS